MRNKEYLGTASGIDRHRIIAAAALGKPLPKGVEIHHVDGNGRNNEHENLVICPDKSYHRLLHRRANALAATGNPNFRKCNHCKQWGDPSLMFICGKVALHRPCKAEKERTYYWNAKQRKG